MANAQQPGSPLMLSLRSYMSEQGCLCISRLFAATKYRLAGQLVVDAPLRREEQADRFGSGSEPGLDPLASAGQLGGGLAAVLVGFAEQALADGKQWT